MRKEGGRADSRSTSSSCAVMAQTGKPWRWPATALTSAVPEGSRTFADDLCMVSRHARFWRMRGPLLSVSLDAVNGGNPAAARAPGAALATCSMWA